MTGHGAGQARGRARRAVVAITGAALLLTAPPPLTAQDPGSGDGEIEDFADQLSTDPHDDEQEQVLQGPLTGVLDAARELVPGLVDTTPAGVARFTDATASHVTVVTTGVDVDVLGDATDRVVVTPTGADERLADGSDAVGYGTWAVSTLLQVAPAATVEVVDVYPGDLPDERSLADTLAAVDTAVTDAVLLAFPPGDVLDPMSRMLASGRAADVFDAALDTIATLDDGSRVVGIPMDGRVRREAEYVGGWSDVRDVRSAATAIARWEAVVDAVGALTDAGVPVVVPAGDLGPGPGTIVGLAGLADVVTVGAATAEGTVAPTSARGPSVHGTAKPDVVVAVPVAGVLPEAAALTGLLDEAGLVDAALPVRLPGDVGRVRNVATSTIPSAATVAAAVAGLHAAGVDDVGRLRGALYAAARPSAARDVLGEGAGVVGALPRLSQLALRPVVSGPIDLGMEPEHGVWWDTVTIHDGVASSVTPELDRWTGTGTDGRRATATVAPDQQPTPNVVTTGGGTPAGVEDGRVSLFLQPGDHPWQPGVFCGYSKVTLVGTSSDVDTQVDVGTGQVHVREDVPTCLVEGMRLDVLNFYIHDVPAQDFTTALLPNLPVGMDLLEGPTMVLPVHPTKERLYAKVSGPDGYTTFGAVLPGFYRLRQFSDYSIDVTETLPDGTVRDRNLGDPLTYSQKDALVLPDPCGVPREDRNHMPHPCHVGLLDDVDDSVGYDKTTGRYLVDVPGIGEQGVVLGWAKKMQLTTVSSRYVDVLGADDFTTDAPRRTVADLADLVADLSQVDELGPLTAPLAEAADDLLDAATSGTADLLDLQQLWRFERAVDDDALIASYRGLDLASDPTSVVGVAEYPFALTTPNYKGTIDWNLTYELADAAVLAIVEVGRERHLALISPAGVAEISPVGTEQPVDLANLLTVSRADGVARLDWRIHPKGAPEGRITLLTVPLDPTTPATVELGDMSMEITTWQRVEWPPLKHQRDGVEISGHQFEVQPRFTTRQVDGSCRHVPRSLSGQPDTQVCEGWDLMVHSGKYDVETFEVEDAVTGEDVTAEIAPAGGRFHDPQRGVTDATLALAHRVRLDGVVDAEVDVRRALRSNGEFFEVLHVPTAVVAGHPDRLVFKQADDVVGSAATTITDHAVGAVPLDTYVPFVDAHHDDGVGLPPVPATELGRSLR